MIQATDPTALVVHSVPRILAALNRRSARPLSATDLEDVVQDTTIVLLGKIDRICGPRPAGPYISQVCRLELRNGQRRARRRMAALEAPQGIRDPEDAGQRAADRELVEWGLGRLGGVEAETVAAKHLDGLTFEEIGVRMSVSPNTAKTRYYVGIEALRRMLGRAGEAEP